MRRSSVSSRSLETSLPDSRSSQLPRVMPRTPHSGSTSLTAAVKVASRVKVLRADLEALAVAVRPATFEEIEAAAERLAASAPPLNDAQVRRLSTIFGGAV